MASKVNSSKQTTRDESSKHRLWLRKIERLLNALRSDVRKKEVKMDEIEGHAFPCYSTKLLYDEIKVIIGNTRTELDLFASLLDDLRSLEERFEAVLNDFDESVKEMDDNSTNCDDNEMLSVDKGLALISEKLRWKEFRIRELERKLESFPSYSTKLLFHEVKSSLSKVKVEVKERENTFINILRTLSQRFDAILNDVSNGKTMNESASEVDFIKNHISANKHPSEDQKGFTAKARKSFDSPLRSPPRGVSNITLSSRKSITRPTLTVSEAVSPAKINTMAQLKTPPATRTVSAPPSQSTLEMRTTRSALPTRRSNPISTPAPSLPEIQTYTRKRTRGDSDSAPHSPNSDSSRPPRKSKEEAIRVISDACQDIKEMEGESGIVCEEIGNHQLIVNEMQDEQPVAAPSPKRTARVVPPKPGFLTCCVCKAEKYYNRVITRFGQYSCEPCYRSYVKFLKRPRQFYCHKDGNCTVVPVDVSQTNGKNGPCQACWLKTCLEKYTIDPNLRELIISNYPPVVFGRDGEALPFAGVLPVEISEVQRKVSTSPHEEHKINHDEESEVQCVVCFSMFTFRPTEKPNYLSELFSIHCCDRCDEFLTECVNLGNVLFTCEADGNCDISGEDRCKGCWLQTGLKTFDFSNLDEKGPGSITVQETDDSFMTNGDTNDGNNIALPFTPVENGTVAVRNLTPVLIGKNIKIFQCSVCGHQNKTKNNLQYHLASTHPESVNPDELPFNIRRVHKMALARCARRTDIIPSEAKNSETEVHK